MPARGRPLPPSPSAPRRPQGLRRRGLEIRPDLLDAVARRMAMHAASGATSHGKAHPVGDVLLEVETNARRPNGASNWCTAGRLCNSGPTTSGPLANRFNSLTTLQHWSTVRDGGFGALRRVIAFFSIARLSFSRSGSVRRSVMWAKLQSLPFQFAGPLTVSTVETAEFGLVKSTNHIADDPIPNCHSSQDLVRRARPIMAAFINEQ